MAEENRNSYIYIYIYIYVCMHAYIHTYIQPVIETRRRVPQALYEPLREKLEAQGVIIAVDDPTDWVNSLVITEKRDGSLHLWLDPKHINKNIGREHFQIPTFTEISRKKKAVGRCTIIHHSRPEGLALADGVGQRQLIAMLLQHPIRAISFCSNAIRNHQC